MRLLSLFSLYYSECFLPDQVNLFCLCNFFSNVANRWKVVVVNTIWTLQLLWSISFCLSSYFTQHFFVPVCLDKEPSESREQNNNFDDDDNDDDEDYKRPLRAPKNRENVFGEIPGTLCRVNRMGK